MRLLIDDSFIQHSNTDLVLDCWWIWIPLLDIVAQKLCHTSCSFELCTKEFF